MVVGVVSKCLSAEVGGLLVKEGTLDVESSKANRHGKFRWVRESATTTKLAGVPTDSFSFSVSNRFYQILTSPQLFLTWQYSSGCVLFNSTVYYQTDSTIRYSVEGNKTRASTLYPGRNFWLSIRRIAGAESRVKSLTSRCLFSSSSPFLPRLCPHA